jgi:subtilisin family serine protease
VNRTRMSRWARRGSVALLGVVVITGIAGTGSAVGQPDPPARGLEPHRGLSVDGLRGKLSPRLAAAKGKVTAFVELAKRPAVDAFNEESGKGAAPDQAKRAANGAKADVVRTVDAVVGRLRVADVATRELYRTANAVAGVVVHADAAKVRELANLPEVESIRTVVPKKHTNSSAVQLTKALNVWQQTGKFGDGVRVGIIDDGVDYTHATFGGPGTKEAYDAIDRTKVSPSFFPTDKVVGGLDLAGDDYDAADPATATPAPDPNPLSCGHHGTHVAGTAGGFGVNADGSTFAGDYAKLTSESVNALRIGPGTAPKSLLYAFKVFGCEGSTNLTAQAMDLALDPNGDGDFRDHLDVVNMSLGSDFGAPDDPDALFVRKLTAAGVVPVISGGNGGDLYDVGGSPGTTPQALTVASTRDAYVLRDGAEVTAPGDVAGTKGGQYSQDFAGYDTLDLTKPVVAMTDQANADGCAPYGDADKAAVAGKFVWLEWDDNDATRKCGSAARANNAEAAGAAGAVFSSSLEHFAAGIAGNAAVPVFQLTGSATQQVRPALAAGTLQVRMAGALRAAVPTASPEITDTPSSFTSRGVRGPAVKPDVAAPGDSIASALSGSGNLPLVISGTSMAAPHTAGVAALVKQAHPNWTPEEVKAAVMNSAGANVHLEQGGPRLAPQRVGAGRIDAKAALDNVVLAMVRDDPGSVSVSFGTVEASRPVSLTKTVKVVNKGSQRVDFGVAYEPVTETPGVRYEVSEGSLRVGPRDTATVRVTLKIDDPSALRKTIDPSVAPTQNDLARQFVSDASGLLVFTPASGSTVPLRVPVYAAPKPAADISTPNRLRFDEATQASLSLRGRGVAQGDGSAAYRSLISLLELQAESPRLPECRRVVTSGCTINDTAKGGDLRYVGAASTAPVAREQGRPQDAMLAFGLATWGNWYNVGSNTIPFVDIDTTGDGKPDFESFVTKLTETDIWVVNTVDLNADGATVDIQPVNGLLGDVDSNVFDSNVLVLPVSLAALGIDPAKPSARISYTVGVAGYYVAPGDDSGLIDFVDTPLSFDPLKPGLWAAGEGGPALSYLAMPNTSLVVHRDAEALALDKADSLLALHHHNASGNKASVIKVDGRGGGRP